MDEYICIPKISVIYPTHLMIKSVLHDSEAVYFGLTKKGTKTGIGALISPQSLYQGLWENGNPSGAGQLQSWTISGGLSQYFGNLKNGFREGLGLLNTSKERFLGHWNKDSLHGTLRICTLDKNQIWEILGSFSAGELHGYCEIYLMGESGISETPGFTPFAQLKGLYNRFKSNHMDPINPSNTLREAINLDNEFNLHHFNSLRHQNTSKIAENSKIENSKKPLLKVIRGHFSAGQMNGLIETTSESSIYKGYYKNGVKHGAGIYWHKTRKVLYKGDFANNKMHGVGKVLHKARSITYSGQMRSDAREGVGIENRLFDGEIYIGMFRGNKREGFGKLTWSRGPGHAKCVYIGGWSAGNKNGLGYESIGDLDSKGLYFGFYEDGEREGAALMEISGVEVKGQFRNGLLHGKALFREKGKEGGWRLYRYRKGVREREIPIQSVKMEEFLDEFKVLNSGKFFRIAKKKLKEFDDFLAGELSRLEDQLEIVDKAQLPSRNLEKEILQLEAELQNLKMSFTKNMGLLKDLCLENGVDLGSERARIQTLGREPLKHHYTQQPSLVLSEADFGEYNSLDKKGNFMTSGGGYRASGVSVDIDGLRTRIEESQRLSIQLGDVLVGEGRDEALKLKNSGVKTKKLENLLGIDSLAHRELLGSSRRSRRLERIARFSSRKNESPTKKQAERGAETRRSDSKRVYRSTVKKRKERERSLRAKQYSTLKTQKMGVGRVLDFGGGNKESASAARSLQDEMKGLKDFISRVEAGEVDEFNLPDLRKSEPVEDAGAFVSEGKYSVKARFRDGNEEERLRSAKEDAVKEITDRLFGLKSARKRKKRAPRPRREVSEFEPGGEEGQDGGGDGGLGGGGNGEEVGSEVKGGGKGRGGLVDDGPEGVVYTGGQRHVIGDPQTEEGLAEAEEKPEDVNIEEGIRKEPEMIPEAQNELQREQEAENREIQPKRGGIQEEGEDGRQVNSEAEVDPQMPLEHELYPETERDTPNIEKNSIKPESLFESIIEGDFDKTPHQQEAPIPSAEDRLPQHITSQNEQENPTEHNEELNPVLATSEAPREEDLAARDSNRKAALLQSNLSDILEESESGTGKGGKTPWKSIAEEEHRNEPIIEDLEHQREPPNPETLAEQIES